jgi:hypothetical protein
MICDVVLVTAVTTSFAAQQWSDVYNDELIVVRNTELPAGPNPDSCCH